jgi:dihydroorotase
MEKCLYAVIGSKTQGVPLDTIKKLDNFKEWMSECTHGLDTDNHDLNTYELVFHREEDMEATAKFFTDNGWSLYGLTTYIDESGNRVILGFDTYLAEIVKIVTRHD